MKFCIFQMFLTLMIVTEFVSARPLVRKDEQRKPFLPEHPYYLKRMPIIS